MLFSIAVVAKVKFEDECSDCQETVRRKSWLIARIDDKVHETRLGQFGGLNKLRRQATFDKLRPESRRRSDLDLNSNRGGMQYSSQGSMWFSISKSSIIASDFSSTSQMMPLKNLCFRK